ncbi:MAG: SBBP repeat-containing protein [Deltaproteobacteria bacterium]|nr:SBBP repeat-containing protein [Deltaproteobacteria bacterium]
MRTQSLSTGKLLVTVGALLSSAWFFSPATTAATSADDWSQGEKPRIQENYARLPLSFIANRGQAPAQVKYYSQGGPQTFTFTPEGIYLYLRKGKGTAGAGAVIRLTPLGLRRGAELTALEPQEGKVHYFLGNDPKKWHTNLPTYRAVLYREAYPGIDLKFYGTGRQMEYDIIVKPGADPGRVQFQYSGIKKLALTATGDLAITLPDGGELIQKKPLIYQEIAGRRLSRDGRFQVARVAGHWRYGFQVASYDRTHPLIIDPVLVYSTFLGGANQDAGNAIAVDQEGNAYVTGVTQSADFPSKPLSALLGPEDAFVTKINAAGTGLVFSLFLGGNGHDGGTGIAVDSAQNIWVTGYTDSANFPLQNAFQGTFGGGGRDAFVTKIKADGSGLLYSTYLGGSGYDLAHGIALDAAGNAYITGETASANFPIYNWLSGTSTYKGEQDCFMAKFSPGQGDNGLTFSSYLGGEGMKTGYGVAVDKDNNAYVAGGTLIFGPDLLPPSSQAFVTKLTNTSGSPPAVAYTKTLAGGTALGIAVDKSGSAYVTGSTSSSYFPTKNPIYGYVAGTEAFVSKINPAGTDLVYSTYLPGWFTERGNGIAVDRFGNAYITGKTDSGNFPVKNGTPWTSFDDVFVTKINRNGDLILYSTCIGGLSSEWGNGIALDRLGNVYVTGYTGSSDFPLESPIYSHYNGGVDAFVVKLRTTINAYPTLDMLNNPD